MIDEWNEVKKWYGGKCGKELCEIKFNYSIEKLATTTEYSYK